jgi:hypothetical protein
VCVFDEAGWVFLAELGVARQVLYHMSHLPTVFVTGFFKTGSRELLAQTGFELNSS